MIQSFAYDNAYLHGGGFFDLSVMNPLISPLDRYNYKITELPEKWPVRTSGESKFSYYTIPFYFKC